MADIKEKLGWKKLPSGDVLAPGTAEKFETGDWRTARPGHDDNALNLCL